jgi:hypothetical protein
VTYTAAAQAVKALTLPSSDTVRNHAPCQGIDACRRCALFRDRFQFCSSLVDLVVGVGHHRGGGHRLTLAGERFVGLVAQDFA